MTEHTYDTVDEIDTGVSEDAFQDPVLSEYQTEGEQEHWQAELLASRKEREEFNLQGIDTIKRFAGDRKKDSKHSDFNVFYANTEIKSSALYARTPAPDIKRRFNDANDQIARVGAVALQRNIMYELECEGFDAKLKQMLWDRLVPGIGIGWARLDQEEGEHDYETIGHDEVGNEIQQPIEGSHIKYQLADIDYVAWDDFLWASCRNWSDCRWVGRRVPMSKPALKARFAGKVDDSVIDSLSFSLPSATTPVGAKDTLRPKNATQATVDVHELWDKERGLIFWIAESCSLPLDVQKDTNEFPGFFPTPLPPMCRTTTSSTTPISDFSLVRDLYNELNSLNNRCSKLVRALQLKFVYDAQNPELKALFTTVGELEGVGVKDWSVQVSEKGGIRGSIEFVPLQEIADAYMKLVQARDMVKAQIYEIEGISDFLRGIQQPYVTGTAAQATNAQGSTRLSVMQMEVADYIQRLLRLKAHLICKFYKPETIMQRAGSMPDADMQFVPQALQLLKDEQLRHFRLEVSVDSIQQQNWNQDKADKNELAHSVTALLQQILPASQTMPQILPAGISLIKFMVSGYKGAKEFEGTLDAMLQQLTSAVAGKAQMPPKPTPEMMKAQTAQMQIQATAQANEQTNQTNLQIAQMQAQIKAQKLQIDALNAQTKAKVAEASIARDQAHTHIAVIEGAHSQAMDTSGLGAL